MSTIDRDDPPRDPAAAEAWQIEMQLPRLRQEERHDLAAALGERLLEIREAALGPSHPETTELATNVAESYLQMSRYDRAEALLERALRDYEAAASPDPSALAGVLRQLAKLYRRNGALERVEPLLRRALDVYSNAPSRDYAGIAAASHGLALLLEDRGEFAQAEALCRAALEIRERLFGEDAVSVAESLNSLAVISRKKGDLDEAERLYLRALAIYEAKEAKDHPSTVTTLVNLGILHTEQEQHEKAGVVLARAAAVIEARGGPEDERAGAVHDALAGHYQALGDDARAVTAARRALAIREELLGPSHPSVALSLNNLATKLAIAPETRAEARALLQRTLDIVGGKDVVEPSLEAETLLNLAFMADDLEEAEVLATRAHALLRERLGPEDPKVGGALTVLSEIARRRGDKDRAVELTISAMKLNAKRPRVASAIVDLVRAATLLLEMDEPAEAGKFLRDALELAVRFRGKDHPSAGHIIFLAGKVAVAQKNPKLSLHCFSNALAIQDKTRSRTDLSLIDVLHPLGEANLALGKLGAAEAAYRRMGEIYAANYPPGSEWHAITPALLGEVAMKRKAYGRAAELFEEALALAERAFGGESLRLRVMLDKAGEAHLKAGSLARAEELSRRLLALYETEVDSESHPALLSVLRRLGDVYLRTGDPRAEETVKRTLRVIEATTAAVKAETAEIKAKTARRRGSS